MSKRCELTDLFVDQCGHCKKPPIGLNEIVYITKGGMVFHNDPKCEYLSSGQSFAANKGFEIHPINPIGWMHAMTSRGACELCCLSYHEANLTKPE